MINYTPPKLFKLTTKGQIQEWQISVEDNVIIREYGLQLGKKQINTEEIKVGKNIGRSNETTSKQQAVSEAQSDWEKKLAKDYFLNEEHAKAQKHRLAKEGGYLPMLAQEHSKHAERHLHYPCYVQPKLDGIRCIATKFDGVVNLWFRSGKRILTLPLINEQLTPLMNNGEIFDGELYIHGEEFNEFTGAIRANKTMKEQITDRIQYWIYDSPIIHIHKEAVPFSTRFGQLVMRFSDKELFNIKLTETRFVDSEQEALEYYEKYVGQGYEGMMFRNANMPYEQKRSYSLLKYKVFDDAEFKIVDYVEGKGTLVGHVGAFVLINEDGNLFNAKMKGKTAYLKELFENPEQFKGENLTVKYFGRSKDNIPRFPVGLSVRFDK